MSSISLVFSFFDFWKEKKIAKIAIREMHPIFLFILGLLKELIIFIC